MVKRLILAVILGSLLTSCDAMLVATSQYQYQNGQCVTKHSAVSSYMDGKWQSGTVVYNDGDDRYAVDNWVGNMQEPLINYDFGEYYKTCPVNNIEYKFTVYCTAY